jgi:hypothetical protein
MRGRSEHVEREVLAGAGDVVVDEQRGRVVVHASISPGQ